MPSIAIVHNNIDDRSSIGSIAAWDAREAVRRGWDVLAVCRDLDPALAGSVTHLPLYVPPRLHLVQYAAGRTTVRRALRGHHPDVVITHQPQTAAMADVWNVHFLERAARDVAVARDPGLRAGIEDVLSGGVTRLEDRYLRQVPESTRILFCSESLQGQFDRLYGPHRNARVLYNPAPAAHDRDDAGAAEARRRLTGGWSGPVVGFLGGGDARKGADLVRRAVVDEDGLFLLHAGPVPWDARDDHRLGGRVRGLGNLADVSELLDAVDVLVVPSRFEPFGLVVAEAAARGVPVLVSEATGSSALVLRTGAGAVWNGDVPLTPLVRDAVDHRAGYVAGGRALVAELDRAALADERFTEFERAQRIKRSR